MNILELKTLVSKIKSLNDADLYNELTNAGIETVDAASRTFKGLKCLSRINKLLRKEQKNTVKDYDKMQVEGTPFTVGQAVRWLRAASEAYYYNYEADITNEEYDWVYSSLKKVLPYHPIFTEKLLVKSKLEKELFLLNNSIYMPSRISLVYDSASKLFMLHESFDILKKWMLNVGREDELFCCRPNYQGVGVVLYYEHGVLEKALTISDGIAGVNVLSCVYEIENIPKALPTSESAEIRGTIVLRKSQLRELQRQGVITGLQSARHVVLSTLKLGSMAMIAKRGLSFCAWDYLPNNQEFVMRENEKLKTLVSLGFERIGEFSIVSIMEMDDILSYYQYLKSCSKLCVGSNVPIWQDVDLSGIIITVNDNKCQRTLGCDEYALRYAALMPFPSKFITATVTDIFWEVQKNGHVKPIVNFQPLLVDGILIKSLRKESFKTLNEANVTVNCKILIQRRELIFKFVSVVSRNDGSLFDFPCECPSCGDRLSFDEQDEELCCGNVDCEAQRLAKIYHFFYYATQGSSKIGTSLLLRLMKAGLVEDVADLYNLNKATLLAVDDFAESRAIDFIKAITIAKTIQFQTFIQALSIPTMNRKWIRKFSNWIKEDFSLLMSPTILTYFFAVNFLFKVPPLEFVPEVVIRNFCSWFMIPENQSLLKRLLAAGVKIKGREIESCSYDYLYSIVGVTEFPREELIYFLSDKGYKYVDIGEDVDFIVCNVNIQNKAMSFVRKNKINVITEIELLIRVLGLERVQKVHPDILQVPNEVLILKAKDLINE